MERRVSMWIAAAFVTMISFGTNNSIFKWSTGRGLSKLHIQFYFYFVAFLLTFGFSFFYGTTPINLLTILLGTLIGILNANGNIQMSKAFENGPASLTSPLIGTNAIFPILSAGIIFHEKITILQWVGIVVMLGSAMAIQYSPTKNRKTSYLPWMFRVLLAILSFGLLGILMKTSSYLHINSLNILISMYGGGSAYLAVCSLLQKEKWQKSEANVGSLVGIISILGYSAYFYALQAGTASIIFPIVSLNCLIVVLAGYWIFKEKLKLYQVIGVFSALLGIIFTKI
ncbi:DMT family transporter [Neobacillus ginsengisoli]|uniref:Drug/metabolite transporter (DMT)-like permease n=1 Tax=Neobacillus ginsengisoli TaxID=904295 RepID=A0ABT9XR99_9BACI|nr:DMT family transporter [Neobacillus ginsengisoli]MDQ0197805.1 drug/metabolite transporter (DMT)-like permease [Neobacillus ginsengisoli]